MDTIKAELSEARRALRKHRRAMLEAEDWSAYATAAYRAISAARRLGRLEATAMLAPAEAAQ